MSRVHADYSLLFRALVQVIKLSDAVQPLPRSVVMFVHGVSRSFLAVGDAAAEPPQPGGGNQRFSRGAYFIGKGVWGKVWPVNA